MEEYQKIRQIKEAGELSQRAAAAELGLARNTVRKYWDGSNVPWERKPGSGRKKDVLTEDVVAFVSSCLEEDEKAHLKKQKHTARRIYNRLVHEKGFTGGESSVRALVAELRRQPRDAFIPLEYSPGEAVQVDWGEAVVWLAGKKTTLSLWCMRECCSDDFYCCAFYRQNEESFLEGMRNGFEYFGGVPRRIIFDNARVAVKEGFGLHAKATDRYLAMAAHYAFQHVFCNIASGHEKGLVEGLVGFIRRSTLVPAPHVNGIEELNDLLLKAAAEYRSHIIPGRERPVGDYVPAVREHLIPLPPYRYDPSRTQQVRVDEFSLVRFDHNRYSVPYEYSGKTVTVKGSGCRVTIPIFLHHTMTAMVGAIGYYLFSACICDIFSNHAAAMCICGVPFGISYIINIGVIKEFDLFWFIRYGFFTEFLRGRWVYSLPAFWGIWYPVMIVGVFILSIYRRKERKLL